jgi:hypothetical protein
MKWLVLSPPISPHPTPHSHNACSLKQKQIYQMHNSFMLTIRQQIINHKSGGEGGAYENAVTTSNKKHTPYYLITAIMQDSPATK